MSLVVLMEVMESRKSAGDLEVEIVSSPMDLGVMRKRRKAGTRRGTNLEIGPGIKPETGSDQVEIGRDPESARGIGRGNGTEEGMNDGAQEGSGADRQFHPAGEVEVVQGLGSVVVLTEEHRGHQIEIVRDGAIGKVKETEIGAMGGGGDAGSVIIKLLAVKCSFYTYPAIVFVFGLHHFLHRVDPAVQYLTHCISRDGFCPSEHKLTTFLQIQLPCHLSIAFQNLMSSNCISP